MRHGLLVTLGLMVSGAACGGGTAQFRRPRQRLRLTPRPHSVPSPAYPRSARGQGGAHARSGRRERAPAAAGGRALGASGSAPWQRAPRFSATGSMWGADIGGAMGAGGLSLSGIGEGGGGVGLGGGIGLGAVGTIGHGGGAGRGAGSGMGARGGNGASGSSGVQAGEWDDNANYREFRKWIARERGVGFAHANLSVRRFLVVRDADGKGVPRCPVVVRDGLGHGVTLTTTASGRALLFPRAEGLGAARLSARRAAITARARASSRVARRRRGQSRGIPPFARSRLARRWIWSSSSTPPARCPRRSSASRAPSPRWRRCCPARQRRVDPDRPGRIQGPRVTTFVSADLRP